MNLRKVIQILFYYIIPVYLLLILILNLNNLDNIYHSLVKWGDNSLNLLILILFIKPISIIFNKIKLFKSILSYRRELGVLSFWFAVFHSIALVYYLDLFSLQGLVYILSAKDLFLITGFIGFIGMVILGITSNKLSTIKLKRNWKKVQYLAYPTLLMICIHKAESKEEYGPYFILIIYVILKIVQYYKIKKNKILK